MKQQRLLLSFLDQRVIAFHCFALNIGTVMVQLHSLSRTSHTHGLSHTHTHAHRVSVPVGQVQFETITVHAAVVKQIWSVMSLLEESFF